MNICCYFLVSITNDLQIVSKHCCIQKSMFEVVRLHVLLKWKLVKHISCWLDSNYDIIVFLLEIFSYGALPLDRDITKNILAILNATGMNRLIF